MRLRKKYIEETFMKGLIEKRVLITGGAGGIGTTTAARFLEEGARVIILDRDQEACRRVEQQLSALEESIICDVSSPGSVKQAFEQLHSRWGGLDILINNAGISIRHRFIDITPEEWKRVIDINLNGVFFVAQQAALYMLAGEGGVIINMGSTNGLAGYHYYGDYNASKSGVIELSRSMALELGPTIRVNAVCPGFIMTPMQEAEYTPEMQRAFYEKLPLKRLGSPGDIASLFAFLASDEACWITGQYFVIDGGELAGGLASQP
jgi:meso-butanediol dehydrogenase/(S,S)-butanediol dehydrogenase/diacetyl reductase